MRHKPLACHIGAIAVWTGVCIIPLLGFAVDGQSQPEKSPRSGHRFALLVGVNEYLNPEWNTLHAPGNDAELIKGLLVGPYQFPNDNIHILSLVGRQAKREAIIEGFKNQLIANVKKYPDASVVFYYSGHGALTNDGLHETLVPADGRTPGVYDITDDEISDLFDELLKYATKDTNVVFILDSCHSGTLVKGLDDSLISKEIPPDPRPQPKRSTSHAQDRQLISKDLGTGILVRNDAFVAVAAAYSYESAYEDCLPDKLGGFGLPNCKVDASGKYKPYSLFTYYLTQVLRNSPNITYREAVNEVSSIISRRARQHPNVEGDGGRQMLGIPATREDPFFSIVGPISNGKFDVNGGKVQGLEVGTYLAVYKPTALRLQGDKDKICNARVVSADDFEATVQLTSKATETLASNAKVALVTPYLPGKPLRVRLQANPPGTTITLSDSEYINTLAALLKDSPFVEIVGGNSQWDLGIQKTTLSMNQQHCSVAETTSASPWKREVWTKGTVPAYQVVMPDQNAAVYGCHVIPGENDSQQVLAGMLMMKYRQQSVLAIKNARSPYNGQVSIQIVKVDTEVGADGKRKIVGAKELSGTRQYDLPLGQRIKLKVTNKSEDDLNIVILDIGTSGGISIMTPRGAGVLLEAHKQPYVTHEVFTLQGIPGPETFKVIAYSVSDTAPEPNFSVLEQRGFVARDAKGIDSPLGWLFAQAAGGMKEAPVDGSLYTDSWTVGEVQVSLK